MFTAILIDLFAVGVLTIIALSRGLEAALPFATYIMVLVPITAVIPLGLFGLTTQRIVLVMLLVLYFLHGRSQRSSKMATPLGVLMIIHVTWCLVSTANSIDTVGSIKQVLSMVLEYYMLYFIYAKTVTSIEAIHKIMMAMVLAVMTASFLGVFEVYLGWKVMSLFPAIETRFFWVTGSTGAGRVQSTFPHTILFGAALAMAIMLALYLLDAFPKRRVLLWIGLLLMFLNLYKTVSRGPWLGAILGCSLLILLAQKLIRKRILLIGMLSLAVLIIRPGVLESIKEVYQTSLDPYSLRGGALQYRFAFQDAAIERLRQNPDRAVWGYGLGTLFDVRIEGELLGKSQEFLSGDNAWVKFLVETGFVGLAIILLLLLKPLWVSWKQFRKLPQPVKFLGLVLFTNFAVYYFEMYSVALYQWGQNGYMLWMLIALTFALNRCWQLSTCGLQMPDIPSGDSAGTEFQIPNSATDWPKVYAEPY